MIHQHRRNLRFHRQGALTTERTFAGKPWFAHLGISKHACCFFDFNPARGLSDTKLILRAAKTEHSMATAMARHTIIEILGLFIHSSKRDVLLKTELERLMLLLIMIKGGTYVTIIEDD